MSKDNRALLEEVLAENERLSQAIDDSIAADNARWAEGPSWAMQSEFTPGPDDFWPDPVVTEAVEPAWHSLVTGGLPAFVLLVMLIAACQCLILTLKRKKPTRF